MPLGIIPSADSTARDEKFSASKTRQNAIRRREAKTADCASLNPPYGLSSVKTWMPGTSPGRTNLAAKQRVDQRWRNPPIDKRKRRNTLSLFRPTGYRPPSPASPRQTTAMRLLAGTPLVAAHLPEHTPRDCGPR